MFSSKFPRALLLPALLVAFLFRPNAVASFSSMYVFGDGVCATNDLTADVGPLYYGKRNCNGRVWVEVLWQWQGLAYVESKNKSKFGNTSDLVVADTDVFAAVDAPTSLFFIWCNDADFVEFTQIEPPLPSYSNSNIPAWTTLINNSVSRHVQAVNNLYDAGARTIVMPNAVNIMEVPSYNFFATDDKQFVLDRVNEFNSAFKTAMDNLAATKPGLTLYRPNTFEFFKQVLANPASFGLQNPFPDNLGLDVVGANKQFGPGIDYVFWDEYHPTAAFQMHLAEFFRGIVLPTQVNSIARSGDNVLLQVDNVPLGRAGAVQGSANLLPPWQQDLAISKPFAIGGATTETFEFPASGSKRFYRVAFPVVWAWP